jgi:mannose-6-phosphate isomerase-like protein (cupin superfamily)
MIIDARTCSGARFRRPTNEETTWKIKTSRFINQAIQVRLTGDQVTVTPSWSPAPKNNGAYSIMEGIIPSGGGPPLNIHHPKEESFYLLEGTLEITLGEKRSWPRLETSCKSLAD